MLEVEQSANASFSPVLCNPTAIVTSCGNQAAPLPTNPTIVQEFAMKAPPHTHKQFRL
jgi:hypothetical protein